MADFIFRVDSVQLTDAQQEKIASAIRGAVLTELARLDLHGEQAKTITTAQTLGGSSGGGFLYVPIHWYGGRMIGIDGVNTAVGNTLTVAEAPAQAKAA
jgi:hypothetical protein